MIVSYNYPFRTGNLGIMALKIQDAGLPLPQHLTSDYTVIFVVFDAELTAPQKVILDTVMAAANVGDVPSGQYTVYVIRNLVTYEAEFKALMAAKGIAVDAYMSGPGEDTLIFYKNLNNVDKKALQDVILANFVVQVK